MDRFVVVSFYTPKYQRGAAVLRASLDKHSVRHDLRLLDRPDRTAADWQANVRYKPAFLLQMMDEYMDRAEAILWLDADARCWKKPKLLETITEDVGFFFQMWPSKGTEELLSGTMYFKVCPKVRNAVAQWVASMKRAPKEWLKPEQQQLQAILPTLGLSVFRLPREYCSIARRASWRTTRDAPVFQHKQYSRQTRYGGDPEDAGMTAQVVPELRPPKRIPRPVRRRIAKARLASTDPRTEEGKRIRRKLIYARRAQKKAAEEGARSERAARRKPQPHRDVPTPQPQSTEPIPTPSSLYDPSHWERCGKKKLAYPPTGGLTRGEESAKEIARARQAMRRMRKGTELDGYWGDDATVVIMGNSVTLREHDLAPLANVFTIGCNRALYKAHQDFWPNALIMADREPFAQERDAGRLHEAAANGVKIIVSDSVFDPRIHLSPRKSGEEYARAQPPPDFPVYLYKLGPRKKEWNYNDIAAGTAKLPLNFESFKSCLVTCQNISGSLLQAAVIMGAKRIGVIGIELAWPKDGQSHHYGDGRPMGAWPQGQKTIDHIRGSFKQAKAILKQKHVEVFNLSPVPDAPFAKEWGRYPYAKFVKEYCNG